MKILDFVKSLAPWIKKPDVQEDIRLTKQLLVDTVMPVYTNPGMPVVFRSKEYKAFNSDISRTLKNNRQGIITTVAGAIPNLVNNLGIIETEINQVLGKDVIAGGISAKQAVLIRAANHIGFAANYMLDILEYLFLAEAATISKDATSLEAMATWRIKALMAKMQMFSSVMNNYNIEPARFKKLLDKVPDITLTGNNAAQAFEETKIDPFGVGIVSNFDYNLIYHFGKRIAEWQAERYKINQEKKQMLEYQLMNMKLLEQNNPSPKLEKDINYIQSRIERLEYKIIKAEESVGGVYG